MKAVASSSYRTINIKTALLAGVLICYLAMVHVAVLEDNASIASLLLLMPLLLLISRWSLRLLNGLALILLLQWNSGTGVEQALPLIYLPPILINLLLALLFGRTLRSGKTPLITQYSILLRRRLEPEVIGYTRCVTQLWTGFFLLLAGESLLLAVFASIEIWSLFSNLLNYIFTALFFVGEYLFRLRYLSNLEHPSFFKFLHSVVSIHVSKIHRPE